MTTMQNDKKNIVIAGAGFAGVTAALILNKSFNRSRILRENYNLFIINNHHSHLYTPALYEIASIPQGHRTLDYVKSSITIPLTDIFHGTHVEWIEQQVVLIDKNTKTMRFDNEKTLAFEYLILALGSE